MQNPDVMIAGNRNHSYDSTPGHGDVQLVCLVVLLLALLALMPAPALAQTAEADAGNTIDEIVVTVDRRGEKQRARIDVLTDPLVRRIRRELRELRVWEIESQWRSEVALIQGEPPRLSWGYDPRDHLRASAPLPQPSLPLDLMQPATVFSVGF